MTLRQSMCCLKLRYKCRLHGDNRTKDVHADGNICAFLPSTVPQFLSPPSAAGATPSNQSLEAT